jgi:hypothetical protein
MRISVLFVLTLGACDPVWHVQSTATASAGTRVDVPCIEAALQATGLPFAKTEAHQNETLGWSYTKDGLLVMWKPREPGAIVILDQAVGTDAPPGTVAAFRQHRDLLVAKLRESCGPFEALGPEDCARTDQCAQ